MSIIEMPRKFSPPDAALMLAASEADAIEQILDCTNKLVELALNANWAAVLDGMDGRRRMLQILVDASQPASEQIVALQAAVAESERALMRVIAHAIASAQLHGAEFAMYH